MIETCEKRVLSRGLCSTHYYKASHAGTLDQVAPTQAGPCEHCGGPIPTDRRWGARFCSTDCKQEAANAANRAKYAAARAAKPRSCGWCAQALSLDKRAGARFCSIKCQNDWHNHQKALVQRRAKAANRKPCEACGGPIPDTRNAAAVYCSAACKRSSQQSASAPAKARSLGSMLQWAYGITADDYANLLASQGGRCAICGATEPGGRGNRLHVDHCHNSKRVRGLLCAGCNTGLGQMKDDPARLRRAADYLEANP